MHVACTVSCMTSVKTVGRYTHHWVAFQRCCAYSGLCTFRIVHVQGCTCSGLSRSACSGLSPSADTSRGNPFLPEDADHPASLGRQHEVSDAERHSTSTHEAADDTLSNRSAAGKSCKTACCVALLRMGEHGECQGGVFRGVGLLFSRIFLRSQMLSHPLSFVLSSHVNDHYEWYL